MEALVIIAVAGLKAVCGAIAFFTAKNAASDEDFNGLRAQLAENEKTPEGLERNRRFPSFSA